MTRDAIYGYKFGEMVVLTDDDIRAEINRINEIDAHDPTAGIPLREPFSATLDGERGTFVKVEHFNLGPSWMCFLVKDRPSMRGPTISSTRMTDVVRDEPGANLMLELVERLRAGATKA